MKKSVVAVLLHYDYQQFLLQLRDFKPSIVYPGHWGGFSGEIEKGESPTAAGYREIEEELSYKAAEMYTFHKYEEFDDLTIHVFYSQMSRPVSDLTLNEGQEIGIFDAAQILTGLLPSKKYGKHFPIATPLRTIFKDFMAFKAAEGLGTGNECH